MEKIPEAARHLFEAQHIGHIATLMEDGSPQTSPVWLDLDGDMVVFNTAEGRVKTNNLRRDPRVAVSVVNSENPYESLLIRGEATVVEEGADDHVDALAKRYMGVDEYPLRQPGEVRVIVRVEPQSVFHMAPPS